MKITFENMPDTHIRDQGNIGNEVHSAGGEGTRRAEKTAAFSVNIGGQESRALQGGVYQKEKMDAEEVSRMAASMDTDVQEMYLAVMSNSMSAEEFGKMTQDGYSVSDMDIETVVTILDQIKVAVAKGGGEISGFTDDISKETLTQILGSASYAEALSGPLEELSVAYMVKQRMEPTVENLYKAKYSGSGSGGPKDRKMPQMDSAEQEAFQAQVDKVLSEAGLKIGEESRKDADFLLRHEIPLTKENLLLYEKCKPFAKGQEGLSQEEVKNRIATQVYEGKSPKQADLSQKESIYKTAAAIYKTVQELTPEAVNRAVLEQAEGEEITLKALIKGQEALTDRPPGGSGEIFAVDTSKTPARRQESAIPQEELPQEKALLTARRQLEEVRLKMTLEANVKLLRSGFQINTMPMEKLIKELRAAQETLTRQGIPQTAQAAEKLSELRSMPAAALSFAVGREIPFTVESLHQKGRELQANYDRAKQRYETMQTAPRADLGDSMKKAFRSVDEILTDMNREPSEENRRAVRILGFNRLEISEENLQRALRMDSKVQDLFRDLKPGKVLRMIREGVDVLHTDIEELDAYLTAQKGEFLEESEDFARFLHRLDRNGEISPQERERYIGIYRLMRQVENSDGRAEGYLLGSGAEATLENLLTAVRSGKKGVMDYRIDEDFSGVDARYSGKSILEQINASDAAAAFLKEAEQPVTVSNLLAASSVLQEEAEIYQEMERYEKEEKREEALEEEQSRMESYVRNLEEAMTDEVSLREGMETFEKQAEELLREAETREGVTELDVRGMQQIYRKVRFRTALSKENRYQIPVKLTGGYALMNLTVLHRQGQARAEISIETPIYGRLKALFTETADAEAALYAQEENNTGAGPYADSSKNLSAQSASVSGWLFAETEGGEKLLGSIAEKVKESMREAGIAAGEMQVMRGTYTRRARGLETAGRSLLRPEENGALNAAPKVSSGELYKIAKIFLETLRNEC